MTVRKAPAPSTTRPPALPVSTSSTSSTSSTIAATATMAKTASAQIAKPRGAVDDGALRTLAATLIDARIDKTPIAARAPMGGVGVFAAFLAAKANANVVPANQGAAAGEAGLFSGPLDVVRYASSSFSLSARAALPAGPKEAPPQRSVMDDVRRFFGLAPKPQAEPAHPAIVRRPADPAAADLYASVGERLVAKARWSGATPAELSLFVAATQQQLQAQGTAHIEKAGVFTIEPQKVGSPLNVLAWTLREKLGVALVYDARARMDGALATYDSVNKRLDLDVQTIAHGEPSAAAVHELHHAYLGAATERGADPFVGVTVMSLDEQTLSSSDLYTKYMTMQELSTFTKHQRSLLTDVVGDDRVVAPEAKDALLKMARAIRAVALNASEMSKELVPALRKVADAPGDVPFETLRGNVFMTLADDGLHHLVRLETSTPAQRAAHDALAGPGADDAKRAVAGDAAAKLALAGDVADTMQLVQRVLFVELSKLQPGAQLSPGDHAALKDLLTWPGYAVRVAMDEASDLPSKTTELARQRALANERLAAYAQGASLQLEDGRPVVDAPAMVAWVDERLRFLY